MPRIDCIAFAAFQSLGRMPLILNSPELKAELLEGIRRSKLAKAVLPSQSGEPDHGFHTCVVGTANG